MAPPSRSWLSPSFNFGQQNDESTKAMYSFPLRPSTATSHSARQREQAQTCQDGSFCPRHPSEDITASDSDCPLTTRYIARRQGKSAGQKRSRVEMEQNTQDAFSQPDLEHAVQPERVSFAIPASKKAHEMSAKSGDIFGPLLCEMILELIRKKAWSLDLLQEHTVVIKNQQPTTFPITCPLRTSPSPSAKSFEMTPEERIQEVMDDTRFRKIKVIGLYGQGKLDIGGQKANFTVTEEGKRCDACVKFKRDCVRVEPDELYQTTACATCCEKGHRCSFLAEGSLDNK